MYVKHKRKAKHFVLGVWGMFPKKRCPVRGISENVKGFSRDHASSQKSSQMLNKKETKELSEYLKRVDDKVLMFAAHSKLLEQPFPDATNDYTEVLFKNKELLQNILSHHHSRFAVVFHYALTGIFSFAFTITAIK